MRYPKVGEYWRWLGGGGECGNVFRLVKKTSAAHFKAECVRKLRDSDFIDYSEGQITDIVMFSTYRYPDRRNLWVYEEDNFDWEVQRIRREAGIEV